VTADEIKQQGRDAFLAGQRATDCPYTFDRSDFWMRKDYDGFNTVRWKLDAWMAGWIGAQKEAQAANKPSRAGGK
jgi:hypothetical protein